MCVVTCTHVIQLIIFRNEWFRENIYHDQVLTDNKCLVPTYPLLSYACCEFSSNFVDDPWLAQLQSRILQGPKISWDMLIPTRVEPRSTCCQMYFTPIASSFSICVFSTRSTGARCCARFHNTNVSLWFYIVQYSFQYALQLEALANMVHQMTAWLIMAGQNNFAIPLIW